MAKTIEDVAKEYAEHRCPEKDYGSERKRLHDLILCTNKAIDVLTWLFEKPLASRLTDSERERVRDYYEMAQSNSRMKFAGEDRYEQGAIDVLESIFGKELFND